MPDKVESTLIKDGTSNDHPSLIKLKHWQWWILMSLNIFFLLAGQSAVVILVRSYYDHGGNSKWMVTFLQTTGFPVLLIPYFFLPAAQDPSIAPRSPSISIFLVIYFSLGFLIAGDNMLYSVGLLYLSASSYSLICATQLGFNAVFALLINRQKFTPLILNSVVVLSFSASLIASSNGSNGPNFRVSNSKYVFGLLCTLTASALYALILSLMQLSFEKVIKKETFSVVLEMQIYTSIVATCASLFGFFASGEWRTLDGEMNDYGTGKVSYVMTLVWIALACQIFSVGVLGLIFVVSSLFSNVIGTLSLVITPIAAMIFFHDNLNGVKVIAMLMALWGFASYIYQNYLDDLKEKIAQVDVNAAPNGSC